MDKKGFALVSRRMITPLEDKKDAVVLIKGEKILAVGRCENISIPQDFETIDVGEKIITPGFIDIHNHGGMGMWVAFDGKKALEANAARLVETGCTGWLPTVNTLESLPAIVDCIENGTEGTDIIGIHMEGPFLTPKDIKQVKNIDYGLQKPTLKGLREFYDAAAGHLKIHGGLC